MVGFWSSGLGIVVFWCRLKLKACSHHQLGGDLVLCFWTHNDVEPSYYMVVFWSGGLGMTLMPL